MKKLVWGLKNAGPYLAIELLLPGGTLIALLVWLAQRRRSAASPPARAITA